MKTPAPRNYSLAHHVSSYGVTSYESLLKCPENLRELRIKNEDTNLAILKID